MGRVGHPSKVQGMMAAGVVDQCVALEMLDSVMVVCKVLWVVIMVSGIPWYPSMFPRFLQTWCCRAVHLQIETGYVSRV